MYWSEYIQYSFTIILYVLSGAIQYIINVKNCTSFIGRPQTLVDIHSLLFCMFCQVLSCDIVCEMLCVYLYLSS